MHAVCELPEEAVSRGKKEQQQGLLPVYGLSKKASAASSARHPVIA